jgi:hypothetical protein
MQFGLSHKQLSGCGLMASVYATSRLKGRGGPTHVLCDRLVTISTNEDLLSEAGQTPEKKYLGDGPALGSAMLMRQRSVA